MSESTPVQLRYAVLRHGGIDEPHFDLLFETLPGSDLATWRLPHWPLEQPTAVTRLRDHPRLYLEYEGQLSASRGHVDRVGDGFCHVEVGENSVLTLTLLNSPIRLTLRQLAHDQWEADICR